VKRYGAGEIEAGGQLLRASCLLSAAGVVADWGAGSPDALEPAQLEAVYALKPSILLLGCDAPGRISLPLRRALEARGIAVECMGLGAACRTYNVLVAESRPVVAGLFP
jgi:uncharacterized protein